MQEKDSHMKKHIRTLLLAATTAISGTANADNGDYYTRGIGRYPGQPSAYTGPCLVSDQTYRNVALHRAAYASSSIDYNLTAQLATDGIITAAEPARLTVTTPEGPLSLRDKEKTIDGHEHTSNYVRGEHTFIQYDWDGMTVNLDSLPLHCEIAYHAAQATAGYTVTVLVSRDGRRWQEAGRISGKDLPGKATRQMVSSDPNKREDAVRLPLRRLDTLIPLTRRGEYSHVRLQFDMPGCAYWRIYATGEHWMPSEYFASAFAVSADADVADNSKTPIKSGTEKPWIYVDLGTECDIDRVTLHWIHKARVGRIQFSGDAKTWTDVATLPGGKGRTDNIACKGRARYVRLTMDSPDESRLFVLSEMQVWGHGGLTATVRNDDAPITGWQVCREGDTQWLPATVPGTVLTSYINAGAVPDNLYANNMRQISESFFCSDFRYKARVRGTSLPAGRHAYLDFDGINWKAEVWFDGTRLGQIDGAFRRARFDVTPLMSPGDHTLEVHVIRPAHFGAVKVKNETSTDLNGGALGIDNPTFHASVGWDWITSTPGRQTGIWNDVRLTFDGGASLADPLVTTTLADGDTLATMTPAVTLTNTADTPRRLTVKGWIGDIAYEQSVTLSAGERREVAFSPDEYTQLRRRNMRLWWPNGYGDPYLYDAGYTVTAADGTLLDSIGYKAGIRQVAYCDLDTTATFYVNGRRITPLGGNWGFSEANLNYRAREYDAAVRYHREMHCNMIRNWVGQIGDDEFYDACDRYGILVWQDFWLANPWDGPDPADEKMFLDNSADLIARIRRHPSVVIYVGRNEGFPPESLDKALRSQITSLHPQLGYMPSSADGGASGHGPYQLMPTDYYFTHVSSKIHSEEGMPNIPTYESLCRMIEPDSLWPIGLAWAQHDFTMGGAQAGRSFIDILEQRFGRQTDARSFIALAQWLNYDGYRAMFEAPQLRRHGLLIWMTHPCWPNMSWSTYDYYFEPTAAYFAVREACRPVHALYNPVTREVAVVNILPQTHHDITVEARLLDLNGRVVSSREATLDLLADTTLIPFALSQPDLDIYFVRLTLTENGRAIDTNTYIESPSSDGWKQLLRLPKVALETSQQIRTEDDSHTVTVTLRNPTSTPALMVRLSLLGDDGEQILPAIYSDNYFHLMPGEEQTVTVSYHDADGRGCTPHVVISGQNVEETGK